MTFAGLARKERQPQARCHPEGWRYAPNWGTNFVLDKAVTALVGFACKEVRPGYDRDFLFLGRDYPRHSGTSTPKPTMPQRNMGTLPLSLFSPRLTQHYLPQHPIQQH